MRLLPVLMLLPLTLASIFGGSSSSTATEASSPSSTSSSNSSSSSESTTTDNDEVSFLLTLKAAQISSMDCLITLVNMTTQPIGTCLGLTTLAPLVVAPSQASSFSTQLSSYLTTVCGASQCSDDDLSQAQAQLNSTCTSSNTTGLIAVLDAILENYTTSYRTLACSVHYNGTSDLCLPSVLNTSDTANSATFFDNLVSGMNLNQYSSSVFQAAQCTGCMYEMFKAAQYTISFIRGQSLTNTFGSHLQHDCQGTSPDWSNVQDQQIPDALQVQQSTPSTGDADGRRAGKTSFVCGTSITAILMLTWWG